MINGDNPHIVWMDQTVVAVTSTCKLSHEVLLWVSIGETPDFWLSETLDRTPHRTQGWGSFLGETQMPGLTHSRRFFFWNLQGYLVHEEPHPRWKKHRIRKALRP